MCISKTLPDAADAAGFQNFAYKVVGHEINRCNQKSTKYFTSKGISLFMYLWGFIYQVNIIQLG